MAPRPAKKTDDPAPEVIKEEPQPIDEPQLTYEQARDELISLVTRLESGGESLEESMELFKRGEYLAALCEKYLTDARATVEAVKES